MKVHTKVMESITCVLPKGSSINAVQWGCLVLLDAVILILGGVLGSLYGAWPLGAFSLIAETISWQAKVRDCHPIPHCNILHGGLCLHACCSVGIVSTSMLLHGCMHRLPS